MFKLKIFCNDGVNEQYWDDGYGEYETYDKALNSCYRNALDEVQDLMATSDYHNWFEVCMDFEATESYTTDELKLGTIFPVATVYYDKAPWDRENDCDIKIVTGYDIVEIV